jgi:hypothetical protein
VNASSAWQPEHLYMMSVHYISVDAVRLLLTDTCYSVVCVVCSLRRSGAVRARLAQCASYTASCYAEIVLVLLSVKCACA